MEREHRAILTLFCAEVLAPGAAVRLDDAAAHHAQVRRVKQRDPVRLVDGAGAVGTGTFTEVHKNRVTVAVDSVNTVPRPMDLEVIVPVADRDRMLLAAEKCVELQITAWRPAYFARSRSVASRGDGERFRERVVGRMRSALEQSGGAWLPRLDAEVEVEEALRTTRSDVQRLLLHLDGAAVLAQSLNTAVTLAVGPEGGFEAAELELADALGFTRVSLGTTTLRFETALIAGAAVVRAAQSAQRRT